jgi:hypothetical protein
MVVDLKNPGRTIHVGVILTGGLAHLSFDCDISRWSKD